MVGSWRVRRLDQGAALEGHGVGLASLDGGFDDLFGRGIAEILVDGAAGDGFLGLTFVWGFFDLSHEGSTSFLD
jgi:hypothetical protein